MSVLIDVLIDNSHRLQTQTEIGGRWYISKPLPFYGLWAVWQRVKDAMRVLRGQSIAVHYKEDEVKHG
jgi:hypothetical protein